MVLWFRFLTLETPEIALNVFFLKKCTPESLFKAFQITYLTYFCAIHTFKSLSP